MDGYVVRNFEAQSDPPAADLEHGDGQKLRGGAATLDHHRLLTLPRENQDVEFPVCREHAT